MNHQLAHKWLVTHIPNSYRYSDLNRLPDLEAAKLVMDFEVEDRISGFYAYGATGTGKTRALVQRLKRFVLDGEDCIYLRGKQFGDEVVKRVWNGHLSEWLDRLKGVSILGLDEVDKMSFTPRVMAEFFELLEWRTSETYPTLFVAQCGLDRLVEKMPKEAREEAPGIVRRITENCLPIHFERTMRAETQRVPVEARA